ncbi:MAG TPA: BON domain-containing protein [Nitrospiria bacterium]|nr:BON domain-containing protein [Nitrospiria bacterium]
MRYRLMGLLVGWILIITMGMMPVLAESTGIEKQSKPDKWIRWRVDALLHNNNRLDYRRVDVACKSGEITLTGSVFTDYEKAHATLVAGDVPGVKAVQNKILVVEPVNADFALMKKVRSQILQDPILSVTALEVDAEEGVVELHGIVSNSELKHRVTEIIQGVPGVKRVVNAIDVEPVK